MYLRKPFDSERGKKQSRNKNALSLRNQQSDGGRNGILVPEDTKDHVKFHKVLLFGDAVMDHAVQMLSGRNQNAGKSLIWLDSACKMLLCNSR